MQKPLLGIRDSTEFISIGCVCVCKRCILMLTVNRLIHLVTFMMKATETRMLVYVFHHFEISFQIAADSAHFQNH